MSIISATTTMPGLHGADKEDNINCFKAKVKNNLKTAGLAVGTGAAAGGILGLAYRNEKVADVFAKTFDKGVSLAEKAINKAESNGLLDKMSKGVKKLADVVHKNPKFAKTAIILGVATLGISKLLTISNIHNNGKIEGKYQQIADEKKA